MIVTTLIDLLSVGENSNRLAYEGARHVAEQPGKLFNPFFIHGKSGLGKTHLMHAIGNYITAHSNKKVLYVTSERFGGYIFTVSPQLKRVINLSSSNFKSFGLRSDVMMICLFIS